MFVKKDDITYRIGHFQELELKEIIESFYLLKIQPSVINDFDKDMIFIRGHVEVHTDEGTAISEKKIEGEKEKERISLPENSPYAAYPFEFISRNDEIVINVK
jgi:hypothetical protein